MWYTLKVAQDEKKRENKKSQKTFKKVLTSLTKCDMIVKLLFERTAQQIGTLKIEQCKETNLNKPLDSKLIEIWVKKKRTQAKSIK